MFVSKGRSSGQTDQTTNSHQPPEAMEKSPDSHKETFTLMHPAFQMNKQDKTNCNNSDRSQYVDDHLHKQVLESSRILQNIAHDESDGSESEEIDLTSNGCIDFSNNNKT